MLFEKCNNVVFNLCVCDREKLIIMLFRVFQNAPKMQTFLFTRCVDKQISANNPFFKRIKPYYNPSDFEAPFFYQIKPGERVLISVGLVYKNLLYTYYYCCCGGCVSMNTNQMLVIEVMNVNTAVSVTLTKGLKLSQLLSHDFIEHKLCVANINDIFVNYPGDHSSDLDDNNACLCGSTAAAPATDRYIISSGGSRNSSIGHISSDGSNWSTSSNNSSTNSVDFF